MTRELPIIFDRESVNAILAGRKTQTRRVIPFTRIAYEDKNDTPDLYLHGKDDGEFINAKDAAPYRRDDLLWVREAWKFWNWTEDGEPLIRYKADGAEKLCHPSTDETGQMWNDVFSKLSERENVLKHGAARDSAWRSPLFMFKDAARLWLRVTDVRAERLQDITEDDARMEGVADPWNYQLPEYYEDASMRYLDYYTAAFAGRWDRRDTSGYPWKDNPWVWVYEFKQKGKNNDN